MEKKNTFPRKNPDISKCIEFVQQYYNAKGYKTAMVRQGNCAAFAFTKDSLYRKLIGSVPVITGMWRYSNGKMEVEVEAHMSHGYNSNVNQIIGKLFDISEMGIARKAVNAVTDPLFGKVFVDEFLAITEGALTL